MLAALKEKPRLKSTLVAALTILVGLAFWGLRGGAWFDDLSYDYLFRFSSAPITNQVVAVLMDNESYDFLEQEPGQPWDRGLHARLLERLAGDGCALVVLDTFFRAENDPTKDAALAHALRGLNKVVLMAEQARVLHPDLDGAKPTLPGGLFLNAAQTNWGVAWLDPDLDGSVRRHWPFPSPSQYPSLAWKATQLAGGPLDPAPRQRWLRYYGEDGAWARLSYRIALVQAPGFFHNKTVFIGFQPRTTVPGDETDEFRTPYTRWTGESMGGVEIMITSYLNLMNQDWLERFSPRTEAGVLILSGVLLGGTLVQLRRRTALPLAGLAALAVTTAGLCLSHFTNYWFPWLLIVGGQIPCALTCAVVLRSVARPTLALEPVPAPQLPPRPPQVVVSPPQPLPDAPDYTFQDPPFGQGAYGKVWVAHNAIGQWQALKAVYLSNFGGHTDAYEREFNGIKKYKPISDKHPGLLRVDFVSQKRAEGYFYYVMELGDPLNAGWENEPSTYKPRDLITHRNHSSQQKLTVPECLGIGLALAEALDFLHAQGLTHRDIKPQNIIFINGRPKLADVGLIAEIRPPDQAHTYVGTPGYMPPPPETPGTMQADLYALGMMLYVLSTGKGPTHFPEISATLASSTGFADFIRLNNIILTACDPDPAKRFPSAAAFHTALKVAQDSLRHDSPAPPASSEPDPTGGA